MVDVVDRDEFERRCDMLRERGIKPEYADLIEETGALDILGLLEAMTDERLRRLGKGNLSAD